MKQGIKITRDYDSHDRPIVRITKRRGNLTLQEVCELLRYEDRQEWCGIYAIILNCSECTLEGSGFDINEEPKGDALDLYPVEDYEDCPVCGNLVPPFRYCPNCGNSWKAVGDSVEKRLASMREETEREIKKQSTTREAKQAWYWSYIGSIDMAYQLGYITEKRRFALYDEAKEIKTLVGGTDTGSEK